MIKDNDSFSVKTISILIVGKLSSRNDGGIMFTTGILLQYKRTFCENPLQCGNGVRVLNSQTMRTLILNTKYKIVICLQ